MYTMYMYNIWFPSNTTLEKPTIYKFREGGSVSKIDHVSAQFTLKFVTEETLWVMLTLLQDN